VNTERFEADFPSSEQLGSPAVIAKSKWVVMKFGGTSVSVVENWSTIAGLVRNRLTSGLQPMIVHSAFKGVSNALEQLLEQATSTDPADTLLGLRRQHYELADTLGLNGPDILDDTFAELEQLVAGIGLVGEVSIRVHVKVLALGELLATRVGAAYLDMCGLPVQWVDARDFLVCNGGRRQTGNRAYLAATCDYEPDLELGDRLSGGGKVIVTQGFIASTPDGETVLLGRGGSDTSAAYFAAKLQARRLEIWTDVPGMFTADPRLVPSARLLTELHYDEAQELASTGSAVLHPRCISPLKRHGIPLFIRCTSEPVLHGTQVSAATSEVEPQVKGICVRDGLTLISMEGVGMWQEVGFLARAFECFSRNGVSVDLISTSETNITVSIDSTDKMFEPAVETSLTSDLEALCKVRVIRDCAAVSLVGRKIRTILPKLGPALEVFEEERIHLVCQAANDLNLSFVIESEQAPRLLAKLHESIIRRGDRGPAFGPRWSELFESPEAAVRQRREPWWIGKREQLLTLAKREAPAYVYNVDSVKLAAQNLLAMKSVDRILYSVKANANPDLLCHIESFGVDFECVSPQEIDRLCKIIPNFDVSRILFTPNFAPRDEYVRALEQGVRVTLDNLYPLQRWPEIFDGHEVFVRLDPGQGRGHHEHVRTAGVHSKFGIPLFELEDLCELVAASGACIVGLHAHSGSGVHDPQAWRAVAEKLLHVTKELGSIRYVDLGGGLGVPDKPGDDAFPLNELDDVLGNVKMACPDIELWLEPGRYLVAEAGVLLAQVTQTKGKGDVRYVGINAGMNSLIRPALYGAYHEIVNLTRVDAPATDFVTVVGPICKTADRLGSDRQLPPCEENDVLLIANVGAYGFAMSSNYNLRPPAREILLL
jgi:diaminopimelate decarboxylase/aspartate kinase